MKGIPLLNLPDVCTGEPSANHAFCAKHIALIKKHYESKPEVEQVPTSLRDFLKFCGVHVKGIVKIILS